MQGSISWTTQISYSIYAYDFAHLKKCNYPPISTRFWQM